MISFTDNDGNVVEFSIKYHWLPMQCNACRGRGHKSTCAHKKL